MAKMAGRQLSESLKRGAAVTVAIILLILVVVGGFWKPSSTVAAWSDVQGGEATFQASNVPKLDVQCENIKTGWFQRNEVRLHWQKPTELEGQEVHYEVSWNDSSLIGSKQRQKTVVEPEFGPYSSDRPIDFVARVRFTVIARVNETNWQSEPVSISASGNVGTTYTNPFSCD